MNIIIANFLVFQVFRADAIELTLSCLEKVRFALKSTGLYKIALSRILMYLRLTLLLN